jgi:NAD(P)-dependent dehydrogenase (short-subunit alcohol dehydrogenase family)
MANQNPIALITGANKGIGQEAARQLAAHGCIVWLGARDPARGEAATASLREAGADARFVQLDVTDDASVAAAVATITQAGGRLDILVNNAGVNFSPASPPSTYPVEDLRALYDVNVFGAVRVTQAFLPLLRNAPAGRIVMVSSGLGSLFLQTHPTDPYAKSNLLAYNSSKSALNAITVAFAKELAGTSIKISAVCPGYTATDLNNHSGPQTVETGALSTVKAALLPESAPSGCYFDKDGPMPW